MPEHARYALYAAPAEGSPLARFGAAALGYDAATGCDVEQSVPAGFAADDWHALTAEPRPYGFHATLKAPFRLAPGTSVLHLEDAAQRLASGMKPVQLALLPGWIGAFVALVPEGRPADLHALADAVVRAFEPLRAPLTPHDRERRLRSGLSPRQTEYLDSYGYPYVLEEFRFHMTLTGRVPEERRAAAEAGLRALLASELGGPPIGLRIADLCIFEQPAHADRFRIRARFPLAG